MQQYESTRSSGVKVLIHTIAPARHNMSPAHLPGREGQHTEVHLFARAICIHLCQCESRPGRWKVRVRLSITATKAAFSIR